MNTPLASRVSGNLVIVCLTVIILVMVGVLAALIILGRDTDTWLATLVPTVTFAVGYIANTLKTQEVAQDVHEVKLQTNGGNAHLVETIKTQSVLLAQSQPAPGTLPQPVDPDDPGGASPAPGAPGTRPTG